MQRGRRAGERERATSDVCEGYGAGPQNSSPGSSGSGSLSYTRRGTLPLMVSIMGNQALTEIAARRVSSMLRLVRGWRTVRPTRSARSL